MQAVTLTDQAKQYIAELLAANPGKQLWVSINNKGCSGHKYEYRLTDWDSQQRFDEVIDWPDGRLVIESKSLLGLIGSCLDLKQSQATINTNQNVGNTLPNA